MLQVWLVTHFIFIYSSTEFEYWLELPNYNLVEAESAKNQISQMIVASLNIYIQNDYKCSLNF